MEGDFFWKKEKENDVHAYYALGLEGTCQLVAFVILLIKIVGIYLFFKIGNPLSI